MKNVILKSVMMITMICSSKVFADFVPVLPVLNDVAIVYNDPCANLQPGWACPAVMPNDELQFTVTSKCDANYGVTQSNLADGSIALTVEEYPVLHMGITQCEATPVKRQYSVQLGTSLSGTQYVLINKIGLGSN